MNAQGTEIEAITGKPALSLFHGFFSLGGLAGAGISAFVIRYGLGGGPGEAGIAVLLAVIVAVAGTLLLSVPRLAGGQPKFALPSRAVLALGILAALGFALEGAFIDWGALFLTRERAATPVGAAAGVGIFMAALSLFRLFGAGSSRRWVSPDPGRLRSPGRRWRRHRGLPAWLPLIVLGLAMAGAGAANIVPILFSASARTPVFPPPSASPRRRPSPTAASWSPRRSSASSRTS